MSSPRSPLDIDDRDSSKKRRNGLLAGIRRFRPRRLDNWKPPVAVWRDPTDATAKRAFRVQMPTRILLTTLAVFLLLPVTVFLWKELVSPSVSGVVVGDTKAHVRRSEPNRFPAWMEEHILTPVANATAENVTDTVVGQGETSGDQAAVAAAPKQPGDVSPDEPQP